MSTIRINQRLREGYNPDGTPGTVSTGVEGVAGRPPTAEEIAVAVTQWLRDNPITVEAITSSARENNRFGAGATGTPGTYVDLGSHGRLHAFVTAGGTPQTVNLYLQAQNGSVVVEAPLEVTGKLRLQDGLEVRNVTGSYDDVMVLLAGLRADVAAIGGAADDYVAVFESELTAP